eukprot:1138520-Pelagomonas_calceolata.AAC.7
MAGPSTSASLSSSSSDTSAGDEAITASKPGVSLDKIAGKEIYDGVKQQGRQQNKKFWRQQECVHKAAGAKGVDKKPLVA